MATENLTTHQSLSDRMGKLVARAHRNEIHDAIRGIKGIADAIHPFFSELDPAGKDALIVGIAPLAIHVLSEIEYLTAELESLSELAMEVNNA